MRIAVATSLYPAAGPFLADWCRGVNEAAAAAPGPVCVVAANDGLGDARAALAGLGRDIDPLLVDAAPAPSVAAVRATMIAAAFAADVDAVVFCDADDILLPGALALHAAALSDADISVGDLVPFDGAGNRMAPLFGDGLPERPTPATLRRTNVCGFSNTAVRCTALAGSVTTPFPAVTAVDWWLFARLLRQGHAARGTRRPVVLYRQHDANTLGASAPPGFATAAARLRILAEHLRSTGEAEDGRRAAMALSLAASPDLAAILDDDVAAPGPWFADTERWLSAWTRRHPEALPA